MDGSSLPPPQQASSSSPRSNGKQRDEGAPAQQSSKQRRRRRRGRAQVPQEPRDQAHDSRVQAGRRAFDSIYGEGSNGTGAAHQRYYSEYDEDGWAGGQGGGDAESILSHVSLDQAPTYGRLLAAHVLSLLPCLALLLATFMLVWHAPCHVRHHPEDRAAERKACRRLLSDRVSISAYGIGVVCWLAAHALRPALWKILDSGVSLGRAAQHGEEQSDDAENEEQHALLGERSRSVTPPSLVSRLAECAFSVFFVLLKTIALEALRIFSVLLAHALVIAGLVRTPYWHGDDTKALEEPNIILAPPPTWHLHWFDPRFTVAVWLAIGWASTEFVVTSVQMFDRLALYQSDFDETASQSDVEASSMTQALGYGSTWMPAAATQEQTAQRNLVVADNDGSELSDSAATVRGVQRPCASSETGSGEATARQSMVGQDTRAQTPDLPHLDPAFAHQQNGDGRQRVPSNSSAALTDSLIQQQRLQNANEEEREAARWSALREKLDAEMESLQKARSRVELEQTFGQPLPSVPIVLCTLWRIDGWLWNLGSTLLMSASVTLAQGPLVEDKHTAAPQLFPPVGSSQTTLLVIIALHTLFTSIWTLALPRLGFAAVTYTSMLVGVGLCLAASARWGLLV